MRLRGSAALLAFCVIAVLAVGRTGAAAPTRLIVVQNGDASTLDPFNDGINVGLGVGRAFYNGLFGFNETMKVRPVLVTTWSVSADGLTYTFHLRQGVTFHDGTPFNAAAVKANFDRVLDPANHIQKYGLYHTISGIEQVNVVDDNTVQMRLAHPSATLINNLAHPSDGIISPAALAKYQRPGIDPGPPRSSPALNDRPPTARTSAASQKGRAATSTFNRSPSSVGIESTRPHRAPASAAGQS